MATKTAQSEIDKLLAQIPGAGSAITGGPTGLGSGIGGALGTLAGGPIGGMIGSALGSVGGAAAASIPDFIKSDYAKSNEKRLQELKRRQEMGTLGLTEQEKRALYASGAEGISKAAQDVRALQAGTAASLATGAGIAASQKQMADEALIAQKAAVNQAVLEQNLAEKRAQEQELEQRKAMASEEKAKKISLAVSAGITGVQSTEEALKLAKQVRGRAPTSAEIKQFMDYTGISDPKKAAQVFQLMGAAAPEQQELLSGLLLTPSAQGALTAPAVNVPIIK
jgi:hypothetical protein